VLSHAALQIMTDSSLDDGDVARLLVRTIDLLKQVSPAFHPLNLLCTLVFQESLAFVKWGQS
jgi:superfamily II RNA helicase